VAVTVNPAPLTVKANNLTNECGQAVVLAGTNFTATGLFSPDTVTSVTLTNVGTAIIATNAVGSGLGNYLITYVAGVLTTVDTTAPVITVLGANPLTNVLDSPFVDPGATALDACVGPVPVRTNNPVNVAIPGSYTITYTADDGNGNTNTATRTVVVEAPVVIAGNPSVLTGVTRLGNGTLTFGFTNITGASFTVFASTNLVFPLNTWSNLGAAVESPAGSGQYQFTDLQATNLTQRFYLLQSP
jgi:hypothetical protein